MKTSTLALVAAAILLAALGCAPKPASPGVYAYRGGHWFNGQAFESRDVYVANGMFVAKPSSAPDSTIELSGKFVAFGIFPQRRIGELRPGFEASFLVLDGDPIADFGNTSRIGLRVKQGVALRLMKTAPAFPPLGK